MYCSVMPLKIGRCGSSWKKHAEMPILSMVAARAQIASAKMRSKSARVHGRGLVWWQMSCDRDLDQRAECRPWSTGRGAQ